MSTPLRRKVTARCVIHTVPSGQPDRLPPPSWYEYCTRAQAPVDRPATRSRGPDPVKFGIPASRGGRQSPVVANISGVGRLTTSPAGDACTLGLARPLRAEIAMKVLDRSAPDAFYPSRVAASTSVLLPSDHEPSTETMASNGFVELWVSPVSVRPDPQHAGSHPHLSFRH